eukprot:TRINITY_DN32786_c0_g1_i1.p1 TRINITY_DN32786_c0_g1~~TRINITY_DN32786_c0_g1_i1.p1  ORF type:complete len:291 (+),score=61.43 TRINITY_DN32786_c0_g1_i1:49-921(+)
MVSVLSPLARAGPRELQSPSVAVANALASHRPQHAPWSPLPHAGVSVDSRARSPHRAVRREDPVPPPPHPSMLSPVDISRIPSASAVPASWTASRFAEVDAAYARCDSLLAEKGANLALAERLARADADAVQHEAEIARLRSLAAAAPAASAAARRCNGESCDYAAAQRKRVSELESQLKDERHRRESAEEREAKLRDDVGSLRKQLDRAVAEADALRAARQEEHSRVAEAVAEVQADRDTFELEFQEMESSQNEMASVQEMADRRLVKAMEALSSRLLRVEATVEPQGS